MNENNLPTKDVFFSVDKLASKLRAATMTLHLTTTLHVYRYLSIVNSTSVYTKFSNFTRFFFLI
jgi:hypothetical protein